MRENSEILRKFLETLKPANRCPEKRNFLILSRFENVVVGGTFDIFHIGHATLITTALELSMRTFICIMSDEGVRALGEKKHKIEPFSTRKTRILKFIRKLQEFDNVDIEIYKIDDPFSFGLNGEKARELVALIVGDESKPLERSRILNKRRIECGLSELSIIRLPLIVNATGKIISATGVRLGEEYTYIFAPELKITNTLRKKLKKPQANLAKSVKELPDAKYVIAIGDAVTESLIKNGYGLSIGVIDRRIMREPVAGNAYMLSREDREFVAVPCIPLFNHPGTISPYSWYIFKLAFMQKIPIIIRVFGEEDLLGFPAVLLAPKDTLIIYGQPFNSGIVYAFADEVKEYVMELLLRMQVIRTTKVNCISFVEGS